MKEKIKIIRDSITELENHMKWSNKQDDLILVGHIKGLKDALEILENPNAISPLDIPF